MYGQQDRFNLDFHSADSSDFQWRTTYIPVMQFDSTELMHGKHPLVILPERVNQNSIFSLGRANHPVMLNLHQAFQLPAGYDRDTVTVDLHLRLMGMSKVCLQVMGMDLQQNFLRTDSMVVPGGTGWQTVRCSLPLKDVRHLIVGIVGCSKMKALLDFLPSKIYLDRMSICVGGQDITPVLHKYPFRVPQAYSLPDVSYENIFDRPNESFLRKMGLQDKRIIALGETVHGSTTVNRRVFQVIKNSIRYDNCRLVLLEAEMGLCLKMNLYVGGHTRESAIREIMQDVAGHLFCIHELESFLVWLRQYNAAASAKVRILGIEGSYNYTSNALFDYLYEFYSEADKAIFYPLLQGLDRLYFEDVREGIRQHKERLVLLMGDDEYGLLEETLDGIIRMSHDSVTEEEAFYAMLNRDFYLYDNARTFIDKRLKEGEKAIIYAHYKHTQKKEKLTGSFPYLRSMGNRLVAKYQADYAVVAFTVGSGEILTRYYADTLSACKLEEPPAHLLESIWMKAGLDNVYVPARLLGNSVYCIRSLGNSPQWNGNYECTNLYTCADGIVYLRNSISNERFRAFDLNRLDKYRKRNRILKSIETPLRTGKPLP